MAKHKVSELTGMLLDEAVAKAEGVDYFNPPPELEGWSPSRSWHLAGPIIERERIELMTVGDGAWAAGICLERWQVDAGGATAYGPTPLIAAMRAFAASKFGDEVELP